jgi:hypothetical protein
MAEPVEKFESVEIEKSGKNPKRRGRKPNPNFLPYEEAKTLVRDELIPSRSKYIEWWDANKPKALPRFPYRVYVKEWISWNEFLGTNNKFQESGKKWRPIDEATLWAHSLKLASYKEWMDWCRENKNKLPADIPARPDLVFEKWRSWNHWLGNRPIAAIEAKKEAEKRKVFYIVRMLDVPMNVLSFGTEEAGISGMKERWQREQFHVVKMFWFNPEKAIDIKQCVNALSSPYHGEDRQRIVPNVYEIIYHLEMMMDSIRDVNA